MPTSILASAFAQPSFSLTDQILGARVAPNMKIRHMSIRYSSRAMRHKREDGTSIVDARIIQPTRVMVECIAPDTATLEQITNVANDRANFYSITSRGLVFQYMRVQREQISQQHEFLTATPIKLVFVQQLVEFVQPVIFAQSSDSSLIDRGYTMLGQAAASVTQAAQQTVSYVKGLL